MDPELLVLVDEVYQEILEKMGPENARLYGQSIDTSDLKQMVVAAYYFAEHETSNRLYKYERLTRDLEERCRKVG